MSALAALTAPSRWDSRNCFQSTPPCWGRRRSWPARGPDPRCARSCAARPACPAPRTSPARRAPGPAPPWSRGRRGAPRCACRRRADARPQRVQRVEVAEVLRELVVGVRHHLRLDGLQRDRVVDRLAGQAAATGWLVRVHELHVAACRPGSMPTSAAFRSAWLSSEPTSTSTFSSAFDSPPAVRVRDVEHQEVAGRRGTALDGVVARRLVAQAVELRDRPPPP